MKNIIISLIIKFWDRTFMKRSPYYGYTYNRLAFEIANLSTMIDTLKIQNPKIALCGKNSFEWVVIFLTAIIKDIPIVLINTKYNGTKVFSHLVSTESNIFFTDKEIPILQELPFHIMASIYYDNQGFYLDQLLYITQRQRLGKVIEKWNKLNEIENFDRHIPKKFFEKFKNKKDKWSKTFIVTMFSSGVNGEPRKLELYEPTILRAMKGMVNKLCKMKLRRKTVSISVSFSSFAPITILSILGIGSTISLNNILDEVHIIMGDTQSYNIIWNQLASFMTEKWSMWYERWILTKWINTIQLKQNFKEAFGEDTKTLFILNDETPNRLKKNLQRIGYTTVSTYGTVSTAQLIAIDGQLIKNVDIKITSIDPTKKAGKLSTKEKLGIIDAYTICPTGDIASIGPDSELIVHGRSNSRIITESGFPVFPEKIERIVNSFELIEQAFVAEKFGQLILYLKFKGLSMDARRLTLGNANIMAKEIVDELNEHLPEEINIDRHVIVPVKHPVNEQGKLIRYFLNTPPNLDN